MRSEQKNVNSKQQPSTKKKKAKKKNELSFKKHIRDFLLFIDNKLIKTVGILAVVALVLIVISISPMVSSVNEQTQHVNETMTISTDFLSKLKILLFTLVAGIVPYVYIAVLGLVGYVVNEVTSLSELIVEYGYLGGIGAGIIPLVINVIIICVVTALAIYICKTVTVSYKISNIKNMNFTNFRIKLYEVLQKEDKVKMLTKKKEEKLNKLQKNKEKLNYIQILNVSIVICILQFISVVIQHILT